VWAPPHIELLTSSRTEECVEEQEIRESLHLSVIQPFGETTRAVTPSSITTTAPAPSFIHPNSESRSNVDEPKTPTPAPLQQAPLHPQAAAASDLGSAPMPSHMLNVSSPPQIPSKGRLNSNDTLCLTQADKVPSPLMSGVLEVKNAVQDDDDDEEMPSIDMGSDSD
jgi:pre-rRNA-processing protein RIX1